MADKCLKCEEILTWSGKGRPPSYCSVACRRAAEYEIRRLVAAIAELEENERDWRRIGEVDPYSKAQAKDALGKAAWYADEIKAKEARLKELLGASDKEAHDDVHA
jgi:hypothetical protein